MFWQISLYFVNQCLFLKMWFKYFVVWRFLINEGERGMIWSSIIFIEFSMFGSWSSLVYHFVVTTLVLWFQGRLPTQRALWLQVVYLNWSRVRNLQTTASIGGHVWVRLLSLFIGPPLNFLFWLKCFKAKYFTRYITNVAFHFQASHESVWVSVL